MEITVCEIGTVGRVIHSLPTLVLEPVTSSLSVGYAVISICLDPCLAG